MRQSLLPRGPWCCEEGERLGVQVCPECAETSAGFSAAMGPEPDDGSWCCVLHPGDPEIHWIWGGPKK